MASEPPPPPQVSPDGKFYWDGVRWVPMPQSQPLPAQPAVYPAETVKQSHGRRNGFIGAVLLVVLVIVIGVCGSNHPSNSISTGATSQSSSSPVAPNSPSPSVSHTVLTFSGTGYETTQRFKIPSSEWNLAWTIAGDPQYADATFYVYSSAGNTVDSVGGKPGQDSATIHQGKDIFFITVLVANATYTVTITANYPGPDQTFAVPNQSQLGVYTGSGDKSTPTFHVSGTIWSIAVQTGTTSQYTSVTAYVMKASDNSQVSEVSVEGAQGGSETVSYVYVGPGDYYVKVLSANTSWTVTVNQSSS